MMTLPRWCDLQYRGKDFVVTSLSYPWLEGIYYWDEYCIVHHQYTIWELSAKTGLSVDECMEYINLLPKVRIVRRANKPIRTKQFGRFSLQNSGYGGKIR